MPYRFAIIGCGRIAEKHAQLIAQQGILAAVCDTDADKAAKLGSAYGAKVYTDTHSLFKEVSTDIVCICSPNGWHEAHTIQALRNGNHVLCEKPMAISSSGANRMLQEAEKSGKKLFVVKQNRFNPPVALLKSLVDEGKIGRIHSFQMNCFWHRPAAYFSDSWRGTLQWDGGTLFTQFSHFIDLMYWLLGGVEQVTGYRENALHKGLIEFEDHGAALLTMNSGAKGVLQYSLNANARNMEGSFTVFGDRGTVKVGGEYLNRLDYFSVEGLPVPPMEAGEPANTYGFYQGSMSNHHKVYEHLFHDLDNQGQALVEAAEAMQTVTIIEKIYHGSPLVQG
jgi:predicted dehydrogenase